ncbi:MAG: hypothetical protein CVT79_16925 [Alphaproteobacteria bacterium HGW-Alphaproteobacteria-18]|nr:MAG: hypothetical protein CVT79_16925 [Alphaproteobacteria bacterium HGW-Alphaproteobacteria-18]
MILRALFSVILAGLLAVPPGLAQGGDLPDEDAQPLHPPQPVYPMMAGILGLSGYCEVRFSIDVRGKVIEIQPSCTHPVFCASAAAAMEEVRFIPKRKNGKLVPRKNIIYPLYYAINLGVGEDPGIDWNTTSCVDPRIA